MSNMIDVAKNADVSIATVSRFFSDPDAVSEDTKKKVLKAVEELNYQPNVLARNLRKMEARTVLVIVPDISNSFFSKILRGIEKLARENGYKVLLVDTENDVELEKEYLKYLGQKHADGGILLTARVDKSLIEQVAVNHPVVLACEYLDGTDLPIVSIDNISSARKATEHLISLGHQRIAHITGPMDVILNRDRLKGYKQALINNEIQIEPILIQEGDYSFESGINIMKKFIALESPPTAVFAASDHMAIGAIKAIKASGLKVPEDVAVVGFDNLKIASLYDPPLTTIAQPMYEIGKRTINMLLDLIKEKELKQKQIVLNDRLIIRESCGYKKDHQNR